MVSTSHNKNVKQLLFLLLVLAPVAVAGFLVKPSLIFLNFYFLPVAALGYWLGLRAAVSGAVLCVLTISIQFILIPGSIHPPETSSDTLYYLLGWASFLVLCGAIVGHHRDKLEKSTEALTKSQIVTVLGLAKLAEFRDDDTGQHLDRIKEYCAILTKELSKSTLYKDYITQTYIKDLSLSSVLHDIGKVGIPDSILLKPGSFDAEEWAVMKQHTELGAEALRAIEDKIDGRSFLTLGIQVANYHHERWDGKGYPSGLTAEKIPLAARIVSIADTYDAITSNRVYKSRRSHEEAAEIIRNESGKQFDPMVVAAFEKSEQLFNATRNLMNES